MRGGWSFVGRYSVVRTHPDIGGSAKAALKTFPGGRRGVITLRLKRIQSPRFIPPSRTATRVLTVLNWTGLVRRDPKGKRRCRLNHPPRRFSRSPEPVAASSRRSFGGVHAPLPATGCEHCARSRKKKKGG